MTQQRLPKKNLENQARAQGFEIIAGVDEVGRGCLAGPVIAACVIFPKTCSWEEDFPGLKDSKQLKPEVREKFFPLIFEKALAVGVGEVSSQEIDATDILKASLKAMRLAIESLTIKPDHILVDGNQPIPFLSIPQTTIIKGDCCCFSIAAASIIAKVTRDRLMEGFNSLFPGFNFIQHKGYGTQKHLEELKIHGPTEIHRLTFRGVTA